MKTSRPKSITVFSILNFVFGGFGLLVALITLVTSANSTLTRGNAQISVLMLMGAMLGIIVGVLAIISGIGLIKVAGWGRGVTIAYAIVTFLGAFLSSLIGIKMSQLYGTETTASLVSTLIGGLFRCIYPVILLCYLNSSTWKNAFVLQAKETK